MGEEPVIALFASCRSSTNLFATLCTQKGPKDTYVVAAFASWIWELGHVRLIIQSDGEPAIAAAREALARCQGGRVTPEPPPPGGHQPSGLADVTGRHVRNRTRVLKLQLQSRTEREVMEDEPVMPWPLR